MRTLSSLFISMFTILLIASCDSSTGSYGSFDTYRNGTWLVIAENEAHWDGSQSQKAKASYITQASNDTTLYTTPDGVSVQMLYEPQFQDKVWLSYHDSTITETTLDTTDIGAYIIFNSQFGEGSAGGGYQPHLSTSVGLPFSCDSTYTNQGDEFIYFSIMKDSFDYDQYREGSLDTSKVHHTVKISAAGAYQTATDLVCK